MRVEVPQKVFDALDQQRRRHGVMIFLDPVWVASNMEQLSLEEEAAWVTGHPDLIKQGAIRGFIVEGTDLGPEPPRGDEDALPS